MSARVESYRRDTGRWLVDVVDGDSRANIGKHIAEFRAKDQAKAVAREMGYPWHHNGVEQPGDPQHEPPACHWCGETEETFEAGGVWWCPGCAEWQTRISAGTTEADDDQKGGI